MRKFRTQEEWQALIALQRKSGKTIPEFCRKQGIHPNVFYTKRKKCIATSFVELPVIPMQCDAIKIKIGDVTIEAAHGCSQRDLAAIIATVREVVNAEV
ncbi:MAG: IS66 family insertion sequence element accessory protein TnpA [Ignavibacteria bacterium]